MRPPSLRARLLGFLLVGSLLPVLLMAVFVFLSLRAGLHAQLGRELGISAEDLRDELDRDLYERYRDLKTVADDPATPASPADVFDAYWRTAPKKAAAPSRQSCLCLALLRADGAEVLRRGRCDVAGEVPPPMNATAAGLARTRALPNGTPGLDLFLPLAAPARDAYAVRATLDLRPLSDLLVREKLSGGLDRDVVVYAPDRRVVARKNGVGPAAADDAFPVLTGLDSGFRRGRVAGGRDALAAVNTLAGLSAPLDGLQWKVAVVQPLDDASEQTVLLLRRLRAAILAVGLLALVASLTCAFLVFRSILDPLHRLSEAAIRVREGVLTAPIEIGGDDELWRLAQVFNEMTRRLKASLDRLTELATKDGLTGIANRAAFDARFDAEFKRAARYGHPLSLAVLDIDFFKKFNDAYGHAAGDQVLREVARVCAASCRDTDFVARYGGEEIALVFPNTAKKDARVVLERLRSSVAALTVAGAAAAAGPVVTVSIGVADFPADAAAAPQLFVAADRALRVAKQAGRNRVTASGPTSP